MWSPITHGLPNRCAAHRATRYRAPVPAAPARQIQRNRSMSRHLAAPRHEHTPTAARRSHWPSSTAVTGGLHRQRMCECGVLVVPCQERFASCVTSIGPQRLEAEALAGPSMEAVVDHADAAESDVVARSRAVGLDRQRKLPPGKPISGQNRNEEQKRTDAHGVSFRGAWDARYAGMRTSYFSRRTRSPRRPRELTGGGHRSTVASRSLSLPGAP